MSDVAHAPHSIAASLFRDNYGWLRGWVCRLVRDQAKAEDIAAQAFVELLKFAEQNEIATPRGFLKTVCLRLICDISRRETTERIYLADLSRGEQIQAPSAEDVLLASEALAGVQAVLAGLSPNARAAFLYHRLDGLTYSEIARRLGVSTSRVQQYIAGALRNCVRAVYDGSTS